MCAGYCNRPVSYSNGWTGSSMKWRLMRANLFKCKLICPHKPPFHARSSPTVRIRNWLIYAHILFNAGCLWQWWVSKARCAQASTCFLHIPVIKSVREGWPSSATGNLKLETQNENKQPLTIRKPFVQTQIGEFESIASHVFGTLKSFILGNVLVLNRRRGTEKAIFTSYALLLTIWLDIWIRAFI